jgi:hypothetical protein
LTLIQQGGDNDDMAAQETTTTDDRKPFQFRLRSIFVATAVVGATVALLKLHVLLIIPIIHVLAGGLLIVLTDRKAAGAYLAGLTVGGVLFLGFALPDTTRFTAVGIAVVFLSTATLAGWLIGAIGAITQGYPGVGWSFLWCGGMWFWALALFTMSNMAWI